MSSYKTILKTTSLYAGLRVVTILMNIGISKVIAIFAGVTGIGIYGIYTSVLSLITTISDLGVSKSAIRNIAESAEENNYEKTSETVSLVSKLIFWTGALGAVITITLSYFISIWSFGESSYWFSFVLIGIAVFFTVAKNGQRAIFQGLRKYKLISQSTIVSSILSFLVSLPLIYFYGEKGVIYTILALAVIGFLVSKYYLRKINFSSQTKIFLTKTNSLGIIKLGLSMMLVSFLVSLSGYIIRTYISVSGSLNDAGYFQAGFQIISGYFGIIFTSMATDYFPRISAINKDNLRLEEEVNQQAIVSLLLICPLVVLLPSIMPFVISILYSKDFVTSIDYVNIALFGIIFQAGSQTMGMILLAKNNAKVYITYVFIVQSICLINNLISYTYWGILGLGISFSINMLIHLLTIQIISYKIYKISFNKQFIKTLGIVFTLTLLGYIINYVENNIKYIIAAFLFLLSIVYSIYKLKNLLGVKSLRLFLKQKLTRKK